MILPKLILLLALEEIRFTLDDRHFTYEDWPGDTWITLTSEYELNLWQDEFQGSKHLMATIYYKTNGVIDTQHWWKILDCNINLGG